MRKRYLVKAVEGSSGIEKLSDPPVGRRIYLPGEEIELDDAVNDVAGLKGRGQIEDIPEPTPEPSEDGKKKSKAD